MQKCIIISDNPTGLLISFLLQDQFDSVTLVDTGDHYNFQTPRPGAHIYAVPARGQIKELFAALESKLGRPLLGEPIDSSPITMIQGEPTPFVGFGESKSKAVYPLSAYNINQTFPCLFDWDQLLAEIRSRLTTKVLAYSELTSLQSSGEKIDSLTINMNQVLTADHYIYAADPKALLKLLPQEMLTSRTRTRLARTTTWSRVAIEFFHSNDFYSGDSMIFLTPNQSENEPIVGRFKASLSDQGVRRISSTWETYIDDELTEDAEGIANVIKGMKRLVRRSFPAMEERPKEIITIEPQFCGEFGWASESNEFKCLATNLVLAPPQFADEPGFVRCVASAIQGATPASDTHPLNDNQSSHPTLLARQTP